MRTALNLYDWARNDKALASATLTSIAASLTMLGLTFDMLVDAIRLTH